MLGEDAKFTTGQTSAPAHAVPAGGDDALRQPVRPVVPSEDGDGAHMAHVQPAAGSDAVPEPSIKAQTRRLGRQATDAAGRGARAAAGTTGGLLNAAKNGMRALGSKVHSIPSTVIGAFTHAGSAVGSAIGVSTGVGTALTSVALSGALVLGGGGLIAAGNNVDDIARSVGVETACADEVEELDEILGEGENAIPESYNGIPVGYWGNIEGTAAVLDSLGLVYPMSACMNVYKRHGATSSHGFEKLDGDTYIVGCAAKANWDIGIQASMGDSYTFWFDNGKYIKCFIGDVKSNEDNSTPWGHIGGKGIDVLEFWADPHRSGPVYEKLAEENGWDSAPERVVSFTNNGVHPYFVEELGLSDSVVGGAIDGGDKAKEDARGDAIDGCPEVEDDKRAYDNSSAAKAALSVAYSRNVRDENGYPGTAFWRKVAENVLGAGDVTASYGYRSCDSLVCTAIRWSGVDDDMPAHAVRGQYGYLSSSPRWQQVGDWSSWSDPNLQPGDVLLKLDARGPQNDHIVLFVGEDLVNETTFEGEADVGPTIPGACTVSGSNPARAPGVGMDGDARFMIFRCIDPMNSDTYAHAGD